MFLSKVEALSLGDVRVRVHPAPPSWRRLHACKCVYAAHAKKQAVLVENKTSLLLLPLLLLYFTMATTLLHITGANAQGGDVAPPPPPPPPPPPLTLANIAIGKRTYASSQLSNQYAATFANDGIIPPDGSNSSTFMSGNATGQWLSLDFGELVTISSIALYVRRDCCSDELVSAEFRLGGCDNPYTGNGWVPSSYNFLLGNWAQSSGIRDGKVTFPVSPPKNGRYLTVRSNNVNSRASGVNLAVAELQVYGMSAACTLQVMYGAGYGIDSAALSTSIQPDEAACCQACYTSATCLYWDFVRSSGTCRLKGDQGPTLPPGQSIPGFYRDTDRVAGAKRGVHNYHPLNWMDTRTVTVWSGPEAFTNNPKKYWFTYFYKSYTTPVAISNASFRLCADDGGILFVNGIEPSLRAGRHHRPRLRFHNTEEEYHRHQHRTLTLLE
ncbi:hypothetical protein VOLCADRAFT_92835 [Volvox carteri f. nagariensis]|uniref:F5/8 type C domain-containing protein n=1 Tax=Volvox carteri f. nagariensis TaxID=3068 RepID=D8U0L1_VOLCA|nr:uncharacterized protein VOLCADRAFT_92835 [Volvox carteri f. nagariensis]EFJ46739.1 hypothetical protein VOLCADRAFT_92835 [Volvox carteri f. nagariensis]|eukprot:XP_002952268.1 hypothetical protein VOLCADRAFT_92835 [Volvox carteri f. nagariensis]